jgi:hypothetical protein
MSRNIGVPARTTTKKPVKKAEVQAVLSRLEQMSTQRDRENLVRFGINARKAFGVSIANIQVLARRLGRNHELAAALWRCGGSGSAIPRSTPPQWTWLDGWPTHPAPRLDGWGRTRSRS